MVDSTNDLTEAEQAQRIRRGRPLRLGRRARRLGLALVTFAITVLLFGAVAGGLLFLRLAQGPLAVTALHAPVVDALASRLRPGFKVEVDGVDLEAVDGRPAISIHQLMVRDEASRPVLHAPRAVVALDPLQLVRGAVVPTRLDLKDIVLKLSILPDGTVALSAGTDDVAPVLIGEAGAGTAGHASGPTADATAAATDPPATAAPTRAPMAQLAAAVMSAVDHLTGAGAASPALDRLGVDRGTLILDDRSHDTVTSFRNLDIDFQKLPGTASRLAVSADGSAGRWSARMVGAVDPGGRRSLSVEAQGVTLDDLRAVPALRDVGFDTDLSLAMSLNLGLDAAGTLAVARGRLATGAGFLHLHDPDHEPFFVDTMEAQFHFDAARASVLIDTAALHADTTNYQLSGQVVPPTAGAPDWAFALDGQGVFGTERPGEKPIALDTIAIAGHAAPAQGQLTVDTFRLAGPQVDVRLRLAVEHPASGLLLKGGAEAGRMPAPVMLRLWPTTIAADVRAWLLVNLQSGNVEGGHANFALDDDDLAKMHNMRSVADSHLHVDYAVSDVTLAFMNGVPPLRQASGHGTVTGDTSEFDVDTGLLEVSPGRQLKVTAGSLIVPSTDIHPSPATIGMHVAGGVDALTELLSRDALKPYADMPGDLSGARGQIDGALTVALKLGQGSNPKDVKIGATAQIAGLAIDKLVGKQGLTDGQINLVLDKGSLRIKGDARMFGAPTAIDVKKPAGAGTGEAVALLTLDDAARVKAGLDLGRQLTGPVTARVAVPIGGDTKPAAIDLDLGKATITNIIPGLSKAPGKPGRVTLTATPTNNGVALDNIVCDIGSFSLRGQASLDSDGGFQSARLSQVRLSPGDDMKVDATQGQDALKIVVRGANIDARPFLKTLMGSDTATSPPGKPMDLELHSAVLTGQNSQAVTNVDLRLSKRNGQVKLLTVTGRFGRAPLDIRSSPQGRDLGLVVSSGDAGATLSFLDLYKKVAGGQLDANIRLGDTKFDGSATIHSFSLREDPAMKRLTEESLQQEKKDSAVQVDPSNIAFTKLYVTFTKAGSRMNIRDGGMFGPLMGATVQGWIDIGADRLQLNGTYVPIYGVNNLFSQIPLFGQLLGGDAHEGLLGINYRLSGSIASPNLTVDPLSALAPGFLRKIFGAITDAAQESPAPTLGRQQSTPEAVAQ